VLSAEWNDFIDQIDVSDVHTTAAISLEADCIECIADTCPFGDFVVELIPFVSNNDTTAKTTDWYYHLSFTSSI